MDFITPMKPIVSSKIKQSREFIHQIKWDGIRGLTYIDNEEIKVYTKSGRDRTLYYPEIQNLRDLFNGDSCVLDGELIVLDNNLKPSFNLILYREKIKNLSKLKTYMQRYPVQYVIFDILELNGIDLRKKPLYYRQDVLSKCIKSKAPIAVADSYDDGSQLMAIMKERGFEGIVSKKKDSLYGLAKKHSDWYKTKIYKRMLVVIGGVKLKGNNIKSLLIGIHREDGLYYIGNASLGLTSGDISLLIDHTESLRSDTSSFRNIEAEKDVIWYKPLLTCRISFLEWTDSGSIRHPKIIGFSSEPSDNATGEEHTYYG